jgi:hypothetical protein
MGPNPIDPNWEEEQQGAALNLGVFGGNPHPDVVNHQAMQNAQGVVGMQEQEGQDDNADNADDEADDPWPAWDPVILPDQNLAAQQQAEEPPQLPQHPEAPQDLIDIDMSGSSLRFLRATGVDIALEDVFNGIQSDSSSSSSSDASSPLDESLARFLATQSHCATISLFHRRDIPSTINSPAPLFRTFQIDRSLLENQPQMMQASHLVEQHSTVSGLEIVPWQPCYPALLLDLLPDILNAAKRRRIITAPRSPEAAAGTRQITSEVSIQTKRTGSSRARSLALATSVSNAAIPLVQSSVRRSARNNKADGFCAVMLDKEPSKKRKISVITIDGSTGEAGPVPISLLQSWGIDCGVAPEELSNEALMQTPSAETAIPDDDDQNNI